MEHRLDFIRRLFVVAITVGFASRIGGMEWFTAHRWPTQPEWQAIALLAVGLAAIIESWEGYFASIGNRPQKTVGRFIIDIAVAFAYMFVLLSSAYLPFFVFVMFLIFLLYVFWDISLLIEYRDEFIPKTSVVGNIEAFPLSASSAGASANRPLPYTAWASPCRGRYTFC